jgi:hypothetical protein
LFRIEIVYIFDELIFVEIFLIFEDILPLLKRILLVDLYFWIQFLSSVLNESDLNDLFVDFGLPFNLRDQINVIHDDPFDFASSLYFSQIYILSQHYYEKIRVINVGVRFGLDSFYKFLEFGEIIGHQ